MCDLPLSEDLAMKYHGKIKNIIRVFKLQMKEFNMKDKVRIIQDQLQRIKICHANRRRQREHREQNKQYREEYYQKVKEPERSKSQEQVTSSVCSPQQHQPEYQSVAASEPKIVPKAKESFL
jgi:hypothetical protein